MMNKKIFLLVSFVLCALIQPGNSVEPIVKLTIANGKLADTEGELIIPKETIVFEYPGEKSSNWKEIQRYVTEDSDCFIEFVPTAQKEFLFKDLITISYKVMPSLKEKGCKEFLKSQVNSISKKWEESRQGFSPEIVILSQNETELIYEKTEKKPSKTSEFEIVKMIVSDSGLHMIHRMKKGASFSEDEKDKILKGFRESASLESYSEAKTHRQAFSFVNKLTDSIELGGYFDDWITLEIKETPEGFVYSTTIPRKFMEQDRYYDECLEIYRCSNLRDSSIYTFIESEQEALCSRVDRVLEYNTLEVSPKEIIYTCDFPIDHLQVTRIVRTFLTDKGYYSIRYDKGQPKKKLSDKEISEIVERVKFVKVTY